MREILDREENSRTTEEEWLNIQLEEPERDGDDIHENRGNHPEMQRVEPQPLAPGPTFVQRMRELEETNRQLMEERDRDRAHGMPKAQKSAQESNNNNDARGRESEHRNSSVPPSPADFHSIPTSPVDVTPPNPETRTTDIDSTAAGPQSSATPDLFVNLTDNLYLGNPNLRRSRTRRTEADGAQETNSPHPATQATQATSIPEPNGVQMDDDETMYA